MSESTETLSPPTANPSTPVVPVQPPPSSTKKIVFRVVGLLVLIAIGVVGYRFWQYSQTFEETDDAQIDGPMNIVSSRIPGTVMKVYVTENQPVEAGQLLADIDPSDFQAALNHAQAGLAVAQAQVRTETPSVPIITTTTETRIASGKANVASAQADLAVARRDFEARQASIAEAEAQAARAAADLARYEALVKKDQVSKLEYDEKVAAAKSATATVESVKAIANSAQQQIQQREAKVALSQSELDQAVRNAPQQVAAQQANVEFRNANTAVARAVIEEAKLNLNYTKIYAPVAGIVGKKAVEAGQRVQPGEQLIAIVPLDNIWVTANFKETQLKEMKVGQRATIHVDAYDRDYDGYVDSMPPSTAARFSILPPENASGNYVRVVQRLPIRLRFKPDQDPERRLRPGMSVLPKVWIH